MDGVGEEEAGDTVHFIDVVGGATEESYSNGPGLLENGFCTYHI